MNRGDEVAICRFTRHSSLETQQSFSQTESYIKIEIVIRKV